MFEKKAEDVKPKPAPTPTVPPVSGKCPTCGRDIVNDK